MSACGASWPVACSSRSVTGSSSPTRHRSRSPTSSATSSSSWRPSVAVALNEWSAVLGRQVAPEEYEPANTEFTRIGRSISAPDYLESLLWLAGLPAPYGRLLVRAGVRPPLHAGSGPTPGAPGRAVRPGRGPAEGARDASVHRPVQRERPAGRIRCRSTGHPEGCRSACSSWPTTGARTSFSASAASSRRRARGEAGCRPCTPDRLDQRCRSTRPPGQVPGRDREGD